MLNDLAEVFSIKRFASKLIVVRVMLLRKNMLTYFSLLKMIDCHISFHVKVIKMTIICDNIIYLGAIEQYI
jgi:hypothetical protein